MHKNKALTLFKQMQEEEIQPNEITISYVNHLYKDYNAKNKLNLF